jgi:hypothetical protein
MPFKIHPAMSKSLSWQTPLGLFIIRLIWLFMIHPFVRWAGSWVAWGIMWELSALEFIDDTTEQCNRKNGGTLEKQPGRLNYRDWLIHHGCVGREAGHEYPIYGVSQGSKCKDGKLTDRLIDPGPSCHRCHHLGHHTIRPILQPPLPSPQSNPLPPGWPSLPPGWALRGHQAC